MTEEPKIFISKYDDPFINLSIENQLLLNLKENERLLFLYSNKPCVVLGRFQNPWLECNLEQIKNDEIILVRRQSGGGCVYHDPGNLNFSFLYPEKDFHKDLNNSLIIKSLKNFSISAYASGRSDLLVDMDGPKKFSGSAFKQKKDRSFHHGTLLIDSNLTKLNNYLKAKRIDLVESKSIKSNPATVKNLSEINSAITQETLIKSFVNVMKEHYQTSASYNIIDTFDPCDYYKSVTSWDWRWGETPLFKTKFKNHTLSIKKGILLSVDDQNINENLSGTVLKKKVLLNKKKLYSQKETCDVLDHLIDLVIE